MSGCRECGKDARDANRISLWGVFCSRECLDAFHRRRTQRHAELRIEPLLQIPEELAVSDFDAFALKVAVYALNLDVAQDVPEGSRDPDILALRVKEILLQCLPEDYVRSWEVGTGWSRKSVYSFEKPLPRVLLFEAMRKAGFSWNVSW